MRYSHLEHITKTQVREMALDFGLPVAKRADSQDLCFLGKGDYRSFLMRNAPEVADPGPIKKFRWRTTRTTSRLGILHDWTAQRLRDFIAPPALCDRKRYDGKFLSDWPQGPFRKR